MADKWPKANHIQTGLVYSTEIGWMDIFCDKFGTLVKENTKSNIAEILKAEFSATGYIEKAASEIILMNSMVTI